MFDKPLSQSSWSGEKKKVTDYKYGEDQQGLRRRYHLGLIIYLNGKFVPEEEAVISVFDHGLLYGDGVFEGIRAYHNRVFRLSEHLQRLYQSAKSILL